MDRVTRPTAEVVDLADIVRSARNGWRIVVGFVGAGLIAAIAVLTFVSPVFSGKASVLLKTGAASGASSSLASAISSLSDAAGGGGLGGLVPGLKSSVETEVDILQSRALNGPIVDSLRLQALVVKPRATPAVRVFASVSLPGSFRKRRYAFTPVSATNPARFHFASDGDSGTVTAGQPASLAIGDVVLMPDLPATDFTADFFDHDDAIVRLLDHLSFDRPKTDVAHFEYRGDDSLTAAAVPNLLLSLYFARRKGIDRGVNQKLAEFLAKKVDSVEAELVTSERALRQQREASGVIDPVVTGKAAIDDESQARQQLTGIQMQQATLQQLVDRISSGQANPVQLASYPQYLGSAPINNIVNSLISVQTERQALLGTVTEEDAQVKALNTRAKELEGRLMPLAQTTLNALAAERTSLEQRIAGIQQSLVGLPRAAEAYSRLEREVLDQGKIFAGLQVNLVDARLAAISEGGDVRPLDLAVVPKKPAFPKKSVTLAEGVGGGLFAGLVAAVLVGLIGGRMYDAQDVERRTGLPAVRFESTAPLLVGGPMGRTVLVTPISARALARPVADRLVETALSRSMSATLLDLSGKAVAPAERGNAARIVIAAESNGNGFDANAAIRRLEETHDLVIVELPGLTSHQAAAVLNETRPVLLVAPARRIDRRSLQNAVDLLRRVGAPCAGVVLHGDDRKSLRG